MTHYGAPQRAVVCCSRLWSVVAVHRGCAVVQSTAGFIDETQTSAYFNNQGTTQRDYSFLKSLCRVKSVSAWTLLARNETFTACGANKRLPVYRIAAEDLERALDELIGKDIRRFSLVLGPGTAVLSKVLTLGSLDGSSELEIVIAGEQPVAVTQQVGMTRPPAATELTTHIDLAQRSIFITASRGAVCLQDLHLHNGKSPKGGAFQVLGRSAGFSSANKGKIIVVKHGAVWINALQFTVKWIGNFTDGTKEITSVVEKLGGVVQLVDGTAFENPESLPDQLHIKAVRCVFEKCEATTEGGGFSVYHASLTLHMCLLSKLKAGDDGGAIEAQNSRVTLQSSTFVASLAGHGGGAISGGESILEAEMCSFQGNIVQRSTSGAIKLTYNSKMQLHSCTFSGNSAATWAGAIDLRSSSATFQSCVFDENRAGRSGGAISLDGSDANLTSCTLRSNHAETGSGGAIAANAQSSLRLNSCTLLANRAGMDGGAVQIRESIATFRFCTFNGSHAGRNGGAVSQFSRWRRVFMVHDRDVGETIQIQSGKVKLSHGM